MPRKRVYTTDKPQYEAVKAYKEAKQIVRVPLDMPSDEASSLRQYCADHGLSVAGFIRGLVRDAIGDGVQASAASAGVQAFPAASVPGGGIGGAAVGGVTLPAISENKNG